MQRSWRTAVYAIVTGSLAAGTLAATMSTAQANVGGFCDGSGTSASCTVTEPITNPATVTVGVTATTNGTATVTWAVNCTLNGVVASTSGGTTGKTPLTVNLTPLPATATGGQCTASAAVSLPTTSSTNALTVALTYTTAASPSPSPTTSAPAGHVIKGYDGKCLDVAGNSAANGAKPQIWTCSGDKAQLWTYSSGELIHNGKCLNDAAWGGSGTKQILYTCSRALNDLWTHLTNGEYVLNAKGYKLCLDDPAYSTRNGTQPIVYTCKDSSNQRWALP